jgi:hypothetical protein
VRLHSSRLADGRRLTVYLPTSARARPSRPYPLLVLQDGQNLFEPERAFIPGQHWRVGETANRLIARRVIPPIVICGVDHGGDARIKEIAQFVSGVMPKRTTIGLAEAMETPDGVEQPLVPAQVTAMGIGAEDDIVIVFYNNFTVVKRWKFKASAPPTDDDLKAIEAEVARVIGAKKK